MESFNRKIEPEPPWKPATAKAGERSQADAHHRLNSTADSPPRPATTWKEKISLRTRTPCVGGPLFTSKPGSLPSSAIGQFRLLGDRRLNTGRVPLRQVPNLGLAVPVGDAPVAIPDFYREKTSASLTSLKGCSFIASSLADLPIVRERKDEVF
jgi:hypothetical protein